jgi:AcrR family transcriptional regulator
LAGVATGTIYYYFESKQDLFIAALRDTRTIVLGELGKATRGATTFVAQLQQLLEAALALHERDPGLAAFAGASAIDVQRYPELRDAAARGGVPDGSGVFFEMLSAARRRGEVPADVGDEALAGMVDALLSGLAALASRTDPEPLRDAFAATARLLDGTLFEALAVTDA